MSSSLVELHQQRGQLLERIAHQRATLARQLAPVQGALATADRAAAVARSGVQYAQEHPLPVALVAAAIAAAVAVLRPAGALRWLGRGVVLWRGWRTMKRWVPSPLLRQIWQRYS